MEVPDVVGVGADVEAVAGGQQRVGAGAAWVAPRVPGQRHPVDRVKRDDAWAGYGTRPWLVDAEAVVDPALVASDVDRRTGDRHAEEGVVAGVVDPRRAHIR